MMDKTQIIAQICTAESLSDSLQLFDLYAEQIRSCKFIFASKSGGMPGFSINRDFSDGSVVRSLFNSEAVLVLDFEIVKSMKKGSVTYPIDYSISLDTQAISYLEPYFDGRVSKLPKDFEEVFNFIARDDVNVDPLPYLQENLVNLSDPKKSARIFEKLKAYEVLRSLDREALTKESVVKSIYSEQKLIKETQEQIAYMYRMLEDKVVMAAIEFNYHFAYWHLLAMISIQLNNKRMPIERKIIKLLELCDTELAALSLRELVVAKAYFERGQNLTFFGKIQSGKKDLFEVVDGMAWDMWHIKQMEKNLTLRPSAGARYFFPSFLTCDKRLVEIIDLYPLKACAYDEDESVPYPFLDGDWLESITLESDLQSEISTKFFSQNARSSRSKRREGAKRQIKESIANLEIIVCDAAGITKNIAALTF